MKKNYPETEESGQFWRSTMIDMDSRLRVARGIAKTETSASIDVFQTLKRRGHPDGPQYQMDGEGLTTQWSRSMGPFLSIKG